MEQTETTGRWDVLVTELQKLAGELDTLEISALIAPRVREVVDAVPQPRTHSEHLAFSSVLVRTATQLCDGLHEARALGRDCHCFTVTLRGVQQLMAWPDVRTRNAFEDWTKTFHDTFTRLHPETVASRARALIRSNPARTWTSAGLARELRTSAGILVRSFRAEYGISVRDYIHVARLYSALPAIMERRYKMDGIAANVGYRSKKDFYRAVRKWCHTTPSRLRTLTEAARRQRYRDIRLLYLSGLRRWIS